MRRALTLLAAAAVLAAGCSGGDETATEITTTESTTTTTTAAAEAATDDDATTPSTTQPASDPSVPTVALCEDVDVPVPSVIGTLPGGSNPPWELDGVILTYIEEHRDTYAIRWIDRDHGGTIVLAFTDAPENHLDDLLARRPQESDIAAIEPRPELTVDWTVAESGFAVDVVQVEFTQTELQAAADDIWATLEADDDIEILGMSAGGNRLNRVTLTLSRPTADTLVALGALLPDHATKVCVEGPLWDESMAPPAQDEPLGLLVDLDDDPLVACGTPPFRLSLLDAEPDVDPDDEDPLVVALFEQSMDGTPVPTDGWYTLERTDDTAVFARFDETFDGLIARVHAFEDTPGGWTIRGLSAGRCDLRIPLPDGVAYMDIGLDPNEALDPASTTLHLVVSQISCSGGRSGVENMYPPEVFETETEILIAVAVIPPEGPQTCPGNSADPITIELDAPIGERAILDALRVPAVELGVGIEF